MFNLLVPWVFEFPSFRLHSFIKQPCMRTTPISRNLMSFLTFAIVSCGTTPKEPKDMIVGKWEYVRMEIPSADMAQIEGMDQMKLLQMEGMLKMASWEYFQDGTYKMNIGNSQDRKIDGGTYALINDSQVLEEKSTGKRGEKKTEERKIVLLTNDTLKIGDPDRYVVLVKTSK